jgi:hypothetical protein
MKKALGVVFALALFLLPIAWGVHAEDTASIQTADVSDASLQSNGPFYAFRNFLLKNLMGKDQEMLLDKANAETAKSKLSGLRDRIEGILKRLNNTSL